MSKRFFLGVIIVAVAIIVIYTISIYLSQSPLNNMTDLAKSVGKLPG